MGKQKWIRKGVERKGEHKKIWGNWKATIEACIKSKESAEFQQQETLIDGCGILEPPPLLAILQTCLLFAFSKWPNCWKVVTQSLWWKKHGGLFCIRTLHIGTEVLIFLFYLKEEIKDTYNFQDLFFHLINAAVLLQKKQTTD